MKIIKRDGRIVEYNRQKIENAIMHANNDVIEINRVNKKQIDNIIKHIEELNKKRMLVEDIQDMIETELMKLKKYDLAKAYIIYRYKRALVRKSNITDESILSLIKNNNLENDYKNSNNTIAIQRDLIASEVSKDLTKRVLLPEKIIEAHNNGVLFFHDMEYFLQPIINSCSINLEKVFSNKVIINNNILEEPSDFLSACNILAQIIANVSLSQIGEQSINIKHLSKYLKLSDDNIEKQLNKEKRIKEQLLQKEISNGIKTILYQDTNLANVNFDGYKFYCTGFLVDVWEVENTWAYRENIIVFDKLNYLRTLPETVFLNMDSIIYDMKNDIWYDEIYQEAKRSGILDVVLEDNPHLDLNILRAMILKRRYKMSYSNKLKQIIKREVEMDNTFIKDMLRIQEERYHDTILSEEIMKAELDAIIYGED